MRNSSNINFRVENAILHGPELILTEAVLPDLIAKLKKKYTRISNAIKPVIKVDQKIVDRIIKMLENLHRDNFFLRAIQSSEIGQDFFNKGLISLDDSALPYYIKKLKEGKYNSVVFNGVLSVSILELDTKKVMKLYPRGGNNDEDDTTIFNKWTGLVEHISDEFRNKYPEEAGMFDVYGDEGDWNKSFILSFETKFKLTDTAINESAFDLTDLEEDVVYGYRMLTESMEENCNRPYVYDKKSVDKIVKILESCLKENDGPLFESAYIYKYPEFSPLLEAAEGLIEMTEEDVADLKEGKTDSIKQKLSSMLDYMYKLDANDAHKILPHVLRVVMIYAVKIAAFASFGFVWGMIASTIMVVIDHIIKGRVNENGVEENIKQFEHAIAEIDEKINNTPPGQRHSLIKYRANLVNGKSKLEKYKTNFLKRQDKAMRESVDGVSDELIAASIKDTSEHIENVKKAINFIISALEDRAENHDKSKLESPELELFAEYGPKLKGLTYGSDEYNECKAQMGKALEHHYENNGHHPESYPNKKVFVCDKCKKVYDNTYCEDCGCEATPHFTMNGMNLIDINEVFSDWYSAVKRHADGNINESISINKERFAMSDELANIFRNTAILFKQNNL